MEQQTETINELLAAIAKKSEQNALSDNNNYIGSDGLVYCGLCNTPRQTVISKGIKVFCMCDCQAAEYKREREVLASKQLEYQIEHYRDIAFPPNSAYRYWTFANSNGNNQDLAKIAKNYVERFSEFAELHKGLLLYGEKGTGKSYTAACIANALIDKGRKVYFTNFARIANEMQSSFKGRNEYLDELCGADLLIIDDFQAERNTEYMREIIFQTIDARYNTKLPLIVTTNLTADEIKRYDKDRDTARVISRLLEMCHPYEVKGEDIRKQKLKTDYATINKMLFVEAQESSFDLEELERIAIAKYKKQN